MTSRPGPETRLMVLRALRPMIWEIERDEHRLIQLRRKLALMQLDSDVAEAQGEIAARCIQNGLRELSR